MSTFCWTYWRFIPTTEGNFLQQPNISFILLILRCKIGWKLWYESLKQSQQLGYQYTRTTCTAVASNRLATKVNANF